MKDANMTQQQQTIKQVEAAQRYGVTDRTIRNWEKRGRIVGKKIGGVKLYPVEKLEQLVGLR